VRFVRLVLRNLGRNRRRTVLTVSSIGVSLFLMTFLATVLTAMASSTETEGSALRLITRHKVSLTNPLPESYWTKIERLPGVEAVCPTSWFGGIYIDERNFFPQFAVDPESLLRIVEREREMVIGADEARAWKLDRQGALVARELADRYGWKLGDAFTLKGTIYPLDAELTVRAIYDGGEPAVYFDRAYVEEAMGNPGVVGTYWIKVRSLEDLVPVARTVDAEFANSNAETLTETEKAFNASFLEMLGNVKGLVVNLSLVIAFTILVVAGNSMSLAVRERLTEIAVLKALGFPRGLLFGLLLSESVLVAGIGGLFGAVGFWFLAHLVFDVAGFRIPMLWFTLVPPGWLVAALWTSSLGLGFASGLIPTAGAVRMSILDGLRRI